MADTDRWEIQFKAHRNSERIYTIETRESGAAHFARAALEANGWVIVHTGLVLGDG